MARLKFIREQEGAGPINLVVETPTYQIVPRINGQVDVQYWPVPGETITVEVSNREHPNCYPICYVESESTGKTVDVIRAGDRSVVTDEQAEQDLAS